MRICAAAGLSDTGLLRTRNEDRWYADPALGLFIVADGLGGHAAGEVAAQCVVERLPRLLGPRIGALAGRPDRRIARTVGAALRALNRAVWKAGQSNPARWGMGATVVCALVLAEALLVANVGDSRAYLFRAGELHALSRDHSLAQYWVDAGLVAEDDPRMLLARQQVLQHIGMESAPAPWIAKVRLAAGDRLLLCSDGLTDMLSEPEIAGALRCEPDPSAACAALVRMANLAGGRDNVTVVLADFAA